MPALLPMPATLLLMAALLPMPALLPLIAALLPMPATLLPVLAGVPLAGPPLAAFVPAAPPGVDAVDAVDIAAVPPAGLLAVRPAAFALTALAGAPGPAAWSLCVVCDSSGTSLLQAASIRTADKTQTSARWLRGSFTICSLSRGCLTALPLRATPAHRDDALLGKR
jgi:hypothetical protein